MIRIFYIDTLFDLYSGISKLSDEYDQIIRARDALGLDVLNDLNLEPLLEEIRDLKSVWSSLSNIWKSIDELRETPWASIISRKLRQQLDNLTTITKEMPSKMRQYAPFEFLQETLRSYLKVTYLFLLY